MGLIKYINKNFSKKSLAIIMTANQIIEEYVAQGYDLTLRQIYYQFVARDIIPNKDSEYKRLGSIINDARLAGLIDWDYIQDRTRNLQSLSHWKSPKEIIDTAAKSYRLDKWKNQPYRIEVWIEKDALVGVIESVCDKYDVPYFSCRGYTSQSEMWRASERMNNDYEGQETIILHLGDHDPSGIDMTRDIQDRLYIFEVDNIEVIRIALNQVQIKKYNPPPNPAKITDSRAVKYIERYGYDSWELDALEPSVITRLIEDNIEKHLDFKRLESVIKKEKAGRAKIEKLSREILL